MINILSSRSLFAEENVYKILKHYIKPHFKVVVLGFSFFGDYHEEKYNLEFHENMSYDLKMKTMFAKYGIKEENVKWIYYRQTSHAQALNLIDEADIIYFPGGAPDLMMKRIIEEDLLKKLQDFNKIVMGSSAGAMIQLQQYHISKDNEYLKYEIHQGLGYIKDFFIEVHYKRRKVQKSAIRKTNKKFHKPIYTIPDNGFLIVENDICYPYLTAKKLYNKKGINKNA